MPEIADARVSPSLIHVKLMSAGLGPVQVHGEGREYQEHAH